MSFPILTNIDKEAKIHIRIKILSRGISLLSFFFLSVAPVKEMTESSRNLPISMSGASQALSLIHPRLLRIPFTPRSLFLKRTARLHCRACASRTVTLSRRSPPKSTGSPLSTYHPHTRVRQSTGQSCALHTASAHMLSLVVTRQLTSEQQERTAN